METFEFMPWLWNFLAENYLEAILAAVIGVLIRVLVIGSNWIKAKLSTEQEALIGNIIDQVVIAVEQAWKDPELRGEVESKLELARTWTNDRLRAAGVKDIGAEQIWQMIEAAVASNRYMFDDMKKKAPANPVSEVTEEIKESIDEE